MSKPLPTLLDIKDAPIWNTQHRHTTQKVIPRNFSVSPSTSPRCSLSPGCHLLAGRWLGVTGVGFSSPRNRVCFGKGFPEINVCSGGNGGEAWWQPQIPQCLRNVMDFSIPLVHSQQCATLLTLWALPLHSLQTSQPLLSPALNKHVVVYKATATWPPSWSSS